ncbi:hypothetical protein PhCBS80983_g06383 [Powellomyces hirtus]|uniref:Uncharacterized protein n=1 Tax=Powellomyces hirtus TaxID=109895 RepID=A0A507DQ13_9FUNG|nr:hypothetical protein PhCBS80983_g06383 [Powellomyces hirtus]
MKKLILDLARSSNNDLNSPRWNLSEPISCDKIRYNSIILPLSFDIVHSRNNKISFGTTQDIKTVSLPPGVYSPDDLVEELTTAMNAVSSQTYDVTYDNLSGKITVDSSTTPFKFFQNGSTSQKILGLTGDTPSSSSVTFQNPIDLTGVKMVLVTSQNVRSNDVVVAGQESLNILACIPINQETQTVLCSQNYFDSDFIDTESGLVSTIDIQLLDSETLLPLDLKGKAFTLVIDCHSSGFTD